MRQLAFVGLRVAGGLARAVAGVDVDRGRQHAGINRTTSLCRGEGALQFKSQLWNGKSVTLSGKKQKTKKNKSFRL